MVIGKLRYRELGKNKDGGVKQYVTEVVTDSIELFFWNKKKKEQNGNTDKGKLLPNKGAEGREGENASGDIQHRRQRYAILILKNYEKDAKNRGGNTGAKLQLSARKMGDDIFNEVCKKHDICPDLVERVFYGKVGYGG